MAVISSAITQLVDRAVALGEVRAGDATQMDCTPERFDADPRVHRAQAVRVVTRPGYHLTCTGSQLLRSSTGWVRASDATELVLETYGTRVQTTAGGGSDALRLTDASALARLDELVVDEELVVKPPGVVLRVRDTDAAQWVLLTLGVTCGRHRDGRIRIQHPGAARYARVRERVRPSVREFLIASAPLAHEEVARPLQRLVQRMLAEQGLNELGALTPHAQALDEARDLSNLAGACELRVSEAHRLAQLLRVLPAPDALRRSALVNLLESQGAVRASVQVRAVERAPRADLATLRHPFFLANGFACRG